jgi:hypothetical protein
MDISSHSIGRIFRNLNGRIFGSERLRIKIFSLDATGEHLTPATAVEDGAVKQEEGFTDFARRPRDVLRLGQTEMREVRLFLATPK